jgi:signal peptidase I
VAAEQEAPRLTLAARVRRARLHPVVDLAVTLAIAIGLAYVVQALVVKPFRVPSPSMVPTLQVGDRILADRVSYHFRSPGRGEVVVFHPNGYGDQALRVHHAASVVYVKRLVGLPGDWIGAVRGQVYVCARRPAAAATPTATTGCRFLHESYTTSPTTACEGDRPGFGPLHVPAGQYLFLGDNRQDSFDGRCFGTVPRSQILGRAVAVYWPPQRIGGL